MVKKKMDRETYEEKWRPWWLAHPKATEAEREAEYRRLLKEQKEREK